MNTAALGLRLPPSAKPAVSWGRWQVVSRAHGFHVSRESISGQHTEALTNAVGRTKIFRAELQAIKACEQANFDATAQALASEPLLAPTAARKAAR